jgi:hypothetical protein
MTESSLSRARLRKITLIVLVVTIAAFVTALILRGLDSGSFPLLKITYETLGAIAGLGTAFVVVWFPCTRGRNVGRHGELRIVASNKTGPAMLGKIARAAR